MVLCQEPFLILIFCNSFISVNKYEDGKERNFVALKLLLFIGELNPLVALMQTQSSLPKQELMTSSFLLPGDGLVACGVLQEVWHNIALVKRGVISLENDGRFPNAPDMVRVQEGFDVYDFDTKIYGQRLTAYLLVCVITLITRKINTVISIYLSSSSVD